MRKYEAVLIFAPGMEEESRNNLVERFKGIIETNGSVDNIDVWGNRKLAYEINDYQEGYYVLLKFNAGSDVVDEMDRIAKITDNVIRHMIIRDEE
ncbi:SSU ribosomal protein S6P [Proteiniborus ethanoligenes]|uniref:Small ribosomal subunit protein bS6 n=1 Tax=Proteiniborus ethanoligenes TaxID=415015 RepID=A0A1H3RGQ7_9FIRM|nr:30S ribosomal protein S6 [Proteiniborus ethanoligenes]TAH63152.1 MAG: 30S ribosomal protein S6 [Gottschalkiaceae bacterium]SDZ24846.1 SSU ribosomal protein S6P [Proteiniborus ethanoligenes]